LAAPTRHPPPKRGFERGFNCAAGVDIPEIGSAVRTFSNGDTVVEDTDTAFDVMESLAYESESSSRDFSPFEFTAHEFNEARNSDARWEAFDAGISAGVMANLAERRGAQ
jgi:hypothetical protein